MPTYEYECEECGHRFEKRQKMSDDPVKECPLCGGETRRLVSGGIGIIFKGSGFYATDYGESSGAVGAGLGPNCGREGPCCGRDDPCEKSPRKS